MRIPDGEPGYFVVVAEQRPDSSPPVDDAHKFRELSPDRQDDVMELMREFVEGTPQDDLAPIRRRLEAALVYSDDLTDWFDFNKQAPFDIAHLLALVDHLTSQRDRARWVADYWREAMLAAEGTTWAAHPLCMVLAAMDGESDPTQLGVKPEDWPFPAVVLDEDP